MRKRYKRRHHTAKKKNTNGKILSRIIKISAISTFLVITFAVIDAQIEPIVTTIAQYQCQNVSILAMNEAVIDEMNKNPEMIEGLLTMQQNSEGMVTNITVNTNTLNEVKATLTNAVANRLEELEYQDISIPLGTLIGWQLVSGRGPEINLQIIPTSFVNSTTQNNLTTAGINQTQHSIVVHFTVEMSVVMPGYQTETIVESDVTISETLIVGDVPMFYSVGENTN